MITPATPLISAAASASHGWTAVTASTPPPGKWVLIRTASYRRIARFEEGRWLTLDGTEETDPVLAWQDLRAF